MIRGWFVVACVVAMVVVPGVAGAQRGGTLVRVSSEPAGAAVYVDGAIQRAGDTPVDLRLSPGEHRLRLALEGYADEEQTIEVARARQTLSFRLTPMGRLEVRAADDSARGASVSVDGEELATVPARENLEPGRHQVVVAREGYEPFEQWVELEGGQTTTLTVRLTARPPQQGSIFVAGAVSGAEVFVDSRSHGSSPAVVDVEVGRHVVEVRAEGYEPYREEVEVAAGQRVTVNPTLEREGGAGGSLRVLSTPTGASIWVDGEEQGPAPITVEGLAPGTHIVEARAEGRPPVSERVTIEVGRRETVMLEVASAASTGSLRVTCAEAGATVVVDGRTIGAAPAEVGDLSPGQHHVVVRVAGRADWEQDVTVTAGQQAVVNATPSAARAVGRISVVSSASGAEVIIDGQVVGPAPVRDQELAVGQHTVEVRAEGHQPFTTTVDVTEGLVRQVRADLVAIPSGAGAGSGSPSGAGEGSGAGHDDASGEATADDEDDDEGDEEDDEEDEDEEERNRNRRRFAYSGVPLQPYKVAIDGSWGWPYLIGDYRLTIGIHRYIDVAVAARSSYYYTEIDGHFRVGIRLLRILGVSGELYIGGGFGEDDRSGFVFGIGLFQGLEFRHLAITLRERLHVFSDTRPGGSKDTENHVQFFLGVAIEYSVSRLLHVFAVVDYAPGQDPRAVLCSERIGAQGCGSSWMPGDIAIEGRLGLGLRFF
jgi:hypothetical protein